jgi:uncharacterized protein YprB with RNaseH-like and TPR domain
MMAEPYIVVDIETLPAQGKDLEMELSLIKANSNIKDPVKIQKNIEGKVISMKKKAALLDSSPIACIGVKTQTSTICFTCFDEIDKQQIGLLAEAGIIIIPAENEKGMLQNYGCYLESFCDDKTKNITFNGYPFDLPKIRGAYSRFNLSVPFPMLQRQPGIDLMISYCKYYSMGSAIMISLNEVVQRLGICNGKLMSGAFFWQLLEEKKFLEAVLYNVIDCLMTEAVYFRMYQ